MLTDDCRQIDTAPNVIQYIEAIKHCLKPGGFWINHGPLQWHFESSPTPAESTSNNETNDDGDSADAGKPGEPSVKDNGIGEPGSFQLTDAEVHQLLVWFGFEMLETKVAPGGDTG